MIEVRRSTVVDAPVEVVWRLLRDFNAHGSWHPAVVESRIEDAGPAERVGAVRDFRFADGSRLAEQLIALSDRERTLTYCLLASPLPISGYVATMRLKPVTDRDRTFIVWQSRFSAPAGREAAMHRLVAEDVHEAGFAALHERFGDGRSAAARRPTPVSPLRRPTAVAPIPPEPQPAPPRGGPARFGTQPSLAFEAEAIVVERHGPPETMKLRRVPVPPPGQGEVRLRHTAIGVNFIDIHCRTGTFRMLDPPAVPGMEAAGVVLDVGPGVAHLRPGDRVVYASTPIGAYAAARTMPAALVVPLPGDIDDETAAAVFLKGLTVDFLIHRVHVLAPGEMALVHAAAGGVGLLLCQWARAKGATVLGTVSTAEKADLARRAGCDQVLVRGRDDVVAAVRAATGGRGADVVYDGLGGPHFATSLAALASPGHLVNYGQAAGPVGRWDIDALTAQSATVSRPNFGHYTSDPVILGAMAARVFDALRDGTISPAIGARFPLGEAVRAHARLEAGETVGATVLVPAAAS
jgi:NADPH2:quinone reductase